MGYAGGRHENPTYHDLDGHAEALEIFFDATRISFDRLLEFFWAGHNPTREGRSTQYRSAIFAIDAEQLDLVRESAGHLEATLGSPVRTEITVDLPFHAAEAYHQKWYLRRHPQIWSELLAIYGSEEALIASTAAARLNGYLGRAGSTDRLERDIDRLGLSEAGRSYLRKSAR